MTQAPTIPRAVDPLPSKPSWTQNRAGRPPRVLAITETGDIGGTERVALNVTNGLRARAWDVRSVFPPSETCPAFLEWAHAQGVTAELSAAVPGEDCYRTSRDFWRLFAFVRRSNPDVVWVNFPEVYMSWRDLLAIRLAGRHKVVVTIHIATEWSSLPARRRLLTLLASCLVDKVVVVSRATRERLRQAGVPARKLHVVLNGLPAPQHVPSREEARRRLGLPADAFVVGSLCRLMPVKGVGNLIEAAARLDDPQHRLRLLIGGYGPEREALEQRAAELLGDRAIFLGEVHDTTSFYAALDIFALPSFMEGLALVLIEAALQGLPAVGTAVPGITEVIADGETGLLVPPGDVPVLAEAVDRLRLNPQLRLRLGEGARGRAMAEFSVDAMCERYARVFSQ
jgi:glycosyltransferase involved in cell wall biosynthesis